MKKIVFSVMAMAALAFVGCSNDDDDDEGNCATCAVELLGTAITTEACDNGDGTVTLTANGESQILSGDELEGATPAEFVRALEEGCPALSDG